MPPVTAEDSPAAPSHGSNAAQYGAARRAVACSRGPGAPPESFPADYWAAGTNRPASMPGMIPAGGIVMVATPQVAAMASHRLPPARGAAVSWIRSPAGTMEMDLLRK